MFDEGTRVNRGAASPRRLNDSDTRPGPWTSRPKADRDSFTGTADWPITRVQLRNGGNRNSAARQQTRERKGCRRKQAPWTPRLWRPDSFARPKSNLAKQTSGGFPRRVFREQQQAVDNCTIRAPYAGIVVSKDAPGRRKWSRLFRQERAAFTAPPGIRHYRGNLHSNEIGGGRQANRIFAKVQAQPNR